MSFASLIFFLFLPVVFAVHWLVPRRRWQNAVLLAASYVFYGWWDWRFCFLMLASSLIDYAAGLGLASSTSSANRKRILAAAVASNLLILAFFKYFNFFVDSFVLALAAVGVDVPTSTLNIILPVGISFYTFQTLSYTIDIYRGEFRARRSLLDYLTFVSFFPQLVAGPIERARDLLPQFESARKFSSDAAREGCRRIIWGLAKKMIIADSLSTIVDAAFNSPALMNGAELAVATVAFAFQIYCDFSGYSDVAVGTAELFGIRLMRNFAFPYFSQSITEFWRRWHISLSTWFRDYVYVPLGGNRTSRGRQARTLMTTAVLSGLWHGAAWHFVFWGGLHGTLLTAERFLRKRPALKAADIPGGESFVPHPMAVVRIAITFGLVCLGWIFFRAKTLPDALTICGRISAAAIDPRFLPSVFEQLNLHARTFGFLGLFVLIEWWQRRRWNPFAVGVLPWPIRWAAYTAFFWAILLFGTHHTEEFIYFRF